MASLEPSFFEGSLHTVKSSALASSETNKLTDAKAERKILFELTFNPLKTNVPQMIRVPRARARIPGLLSLTFRINPWNS